MPEAQAGGMEVVRAEGRLESTVGGLLGQLGTYAQSTNTGITPLTSGQALSHEFRVEWDRSEESGAEFISSTGSFSFANTQTYVLESSLPTTTLRTSGASSLAGQWDFSPLDVEPIPGMDPEIAAWTQARASFTLALDQPFSLRLAGRLWSTDPGVFGEMTLRFASSPNAPFITLGAWGAAELSAGIESQWQLDAGWMLFDFSMLADTGSARVPCCNIPVSASSGWDFSLEAFTPAVVPEPAPAALLLAGIAALLGRRSKTQEL